MEFPPWNSWGIKCLRMDLVQHKPRLRSSKTSLNLQRSKAYKKFGHDKLLPPFFAQHRLNPQPSLRSTEVIETSARNILVTSNEASFRGCKMCPSECYYACSPLFRLSFSSYLRRFRQSGRCRSRTSNKDNGNPSLSSVAN